MSGQSVGGDIRLTISACGHRKLRRLRRKLGAEACWSLVCLWMFAGDQHSDGDLAGLSDADIEEEAQWEGESGAFVAALADLRLLDGEPGRWVIHDWAEHQPHAAARGSRYRRAMAGAAGKWGEDRPSASATRSQRLAAARAIASHTPEDWAAMLEVCGNRCVRCNAAGLPLVRDHIVPLYQGGSDGIDNLQPLCRSCNSSKGPDSTDHRPAGWKRLLDACLMPARCLPPTQPNLRSTTKLQPDTPPAADSVGCFESGADVPRGTPNPAAAHAIALNRAGFRCTTLNPRLVAFADAGGTVDHLLQVAALDECQGKPAGYVVAIALRELSEPAAAPVPSSRSTTSSVMAGLSALESLKHEPANAHAQLESPRRDPDRPAEALHAAPRRDALP